MTLKSIKSSLHNILKGHSDNETGMTSHISAQDLVKNYSEKDVLTIRREYEDEYNKEITNEVLLDILRNDFFDCWTGDTTPLPSDKLVNTINAFLGVLKNYFLVPDGHDKRGDIPCLSNRQIYCGISAIELIEKGELACALHEFMDCIDNYGEAQRNRKAITQNEYAFYFGIATVFYNCLIEDKMIKETLKEKRTTE